MDGRFVATFLLLGGCHLVFELDDPVGDATVFQDAPVDLGRCPVSYEPVSGARSRYVLRSITVPWLNAQDICLGDRMDSAGPYTHLVVLDDVAELDALQVQFGIGTFWIGLQDLKAEAVFESVTTQTVTFPASSRPGVGDMPWGPGQPDNGAGGTGQDCARVVVNAQERHLDDDTCTSPLRYLCECDGFADTPQKYL